MASRWLGVLLALFAAAACGEPSPSPTGGGGAAPLGCRDAISAIFSARDAPNCTNCLTGTCCDAIEICAADAACVACTQGEGHCEPDAAYLAVKACARESCKDECYPTPSVEPELACDQIGDLAPATSSCAPVGGPISCSPVLPSYTCAWISNQACDLSPRDPQMAATGFACYASSRHHLCEDCGLVEGSCHFGLTCANYQCARLCCGDQDCGGARCDTAWIEDRYPGAPEGFTLGICVL